jgi:hypothetical protein
LIESPLFTDSLSDISRKVGYKAKGLTFRTITLVSPRGYTRVDTLNIKFAKKRVSSLRPYTLLVKIAQRHQKIIHSNIGLTQSLDSFLLERIESLLTTIIIEIKINLHVIILLHLYLSLVNQDLLESWTTNVKRGLYYL